ncbi:MAG: GTPase, partial [Planctomycetota bacterium]
MRPQNLDPIVALATAGGPAERAVLRLSGAGLLQAAGRILPPGCPRPRGRREVLAGEMEWTAGSRLPAELFVFPGPASATGEDVLEIHLPGAGPVVAAVLDGLHARGVRPAEPGEFTRRAFLNGRIDLTQAEGVLDLVRARTSAGARAAAAVLAGSLGRPLQAARNALADALAELEAGLDFEEGDAADLKPAEVDELLARARRALEEGLAGETGRSAFQEGFRIGLRGAPNAGKTTLFCRLTGATALVSPQAGTTRDRLEAPWRAEGASEAWILADGPGLGDAPADPRDEAARRRAAGERFDLVWWLADSSDPATRVPETFSEPSVLLVWTRTDLPRRVAEEAVAGAAARLPSVWISARTGEGLAALAAETGRILERQGTEREERQLS